MSTGKLGWLSLDSDEEVLWSGEPRMHSIIPSIVVGIIFIPLLGIGLIIIASSYLKVKNTDFVVTNKGVYKKTGILSKQVQKIGFQKVQNISFSQGILGNYFGYGNVNISTAGGSGVEMKFGDVDKPNEVQDLINKEINKRGRKEKGEDIERASDTEITSQILEEVRKTRKTLESIDEKLSKDGDEETSE